MAARRIWKAGSPSRLSTLEKFKRNDLNGGPTMGVEKVESLSTKFCASNGQRSYAIMCYGSDVIGSHTVCSLKINNPSRQFMVET